MNASVILCDISGKKRKIMIQKVLIANRGEIAVRVMRSCKEMGIRTVAVFSEADRTARHVMYADEACLIGPAASKESYLNIDNIIKAARQHHADAIHPGYGFLSENADFARRCKEEGIIFIGPAAETMEAMGDKIAARKRMIAAGVPVVPGTEQPLQSAEEAVRICNEIGYPVMLKWWRHITPPVPSPCLLSGMIRFIWKNLWRNPII